MFEAGEEMLGVGLVCVFHTKVVNAKGERYIAADVSKNPGSVFACQIHRGLEVVLELVVGDATVLLQAAHAFPKFHKHLSIHRLRCQSVLVDYILRDIDPRIFIAIHWCAKVKFLENNAHESTTSG